MDFKKAYGTNKSLEKEGVWVPLDESSKIKVAREGNENYFNALQRLVKELGFSQFQISKGKIPSDVMADIVLRAMGEAILVDWEGMTDDDKPVKYSAKSSYEMLKKYPDFADDVLALAKNISLFQKEVEDAEIKN